MESPQTFVNFYVVKVYARSRNLHAACNDVRDGVLQIQNWYGRIGTRDLSNNSILPLDTLCPCTPSPTVNSILDFRKVNTRNRNLHAACHDVRWGSRADQIQNWRARELGIGISLIPSYLTLVTRTRTSERSRKTVKR